MGVSAEKAFGAYLSVMLMPAKTVAELSLILSITSVIFLLTLTSAPQNYKALRAAASMDALHDWRVLSAQQINRRTLGLAAAIAASEK